MNLPIHRTQSRYGDFDHPSLTDRLERLAEVRRAVVARGRALVAHPSYPDRKIIRAISRLLAAHIRA